MDLGLAIQGSQPILTEGSMYEVLRRDPSAILHSTLAHAPMVLDEAQRRILEKLYRSYLDVGRDFRLPMLAFTNTWKTSGVRLQRTELRNSSLNAECVRFLKEIVRPYSKVLIGGTVGCVGDAYKPSEALSTVDAETVHVHQIKELTDAGVDFLFGATLPAFSEALGISRIMSRSGLPYVLSFVIRPDGTLLDGTPMNLAIDKIDADSKNRPAFYMVNCVHPWIFRRAMAALGGTGPESLLRIKGFKGNTCALSPEELDGASELKTEDPDEFGSALAQVYRDFSLRVISGCCGTDSRHIRALADQIAAGRCHRRG